MSKICPVHIILGNHDGLLLNKDRQDAITPIISALNNPNVHLYKKSGVYETGIDGFNWCVFSCFDEEGWRNVRPVKDNINIALFHGAVWGSKTDIDWEIEGDVTVDLFDNFDFCMLGDIHRKQFLNSEKTIAYCGSTIQQNYGEDEGKGFLFWNITDKENFTCKFVEIPHCSPFVTLDWEGNVSDTLESAKNLKSGSRFRIRSKSQITQADSHEISTRLKHDMSAAEVVFKSENQFDTSAFLSKISNKESNLREIATHYSLFDEFFENHKLTQEDSDDIRDLIDRYFSVATSGEKVLRNSRWQVENIRFDNLFAYGESNEINFAKNTGITGIFGKNTKGKSSIIGALMYCLFNTTDRGPIKNLHIINSRKNFCKGSVDIKLNSDRFRISRGTVKNTTRKGDVYATTSLDLNKIDKDGNLVENLTEEQRRETEKVLRKLIGTSDDFLMTSLASQGGMNRFISEGSSNRKSILTKFLDLEVFDKMTDQCKQDSATIRALSRSIKKEDWEKKIDEENLVLENRQENLNKIENDIGANREILEKLKEKRSNLGYEVEECYSQRQIDQKIKEIKECKKDIKSQSILMSKVELESKEMNEKLSKINGVCDSISIDELRDQHRAKINLDKKIIELANTHEKSLARLTRLKESADMLNVVPCGTSFPDCTFIKSSHEDKGNIDNQLETVNESLSLLKSCKDSLKIIKKVNPEEKIIKYDTLILKSVALEGKIKTNNEKIINISESLQRLQNGLDSKNQLLRKMEMMVESEKDQDKLSLQEKIDEISDEIKKFEILKVDKIGKIVESNLSIKSLINDKENHDQIRRQMRVYDLFLQATSKKGIPSRIMMSKLPLINSEILNILQGVVDFTVSLETDPATSSMEIYIDYGDSKRVIELASGMEKMIASLAIRAALINTSSLTKTNMMIIDEGFGSLDATNLEACTRLLESLKKWFRNIIVISHVDAVKDCVDNSIEISKRGKDSHVTFN